MRSRLTRIACGLILAAALGCKSQPDLPPEPPAPLRRRPAPLGSESAAAPASSTSLAIEKDLQARKLRPAPRREHAPRLAFGHGVFGQLTSDGLRLFDSHSFKPLASVPLEAPRALLGLADGALLAIGAERMLRWEPDHGKARVLPRPVLLPGTEVFADPLTADLIWVFDPGGRASAHPSLSSFRLAQGDELVALPEQTIALGSPQGGVFGVTREGVWLYVAQGRVERFSPGGLRLAGLTLAGATLPPTWALPAQRVDEGLWLDEGGQLQRVLVSPSFKRLASARLAGTAFVADVGDEGRLLAVVEVTGEGPRFELELFNNELAAVARVVLPSDPPTGTEDWLKVVTENQNVAVAGREARVAVGGPGRVTIFDARGKQIFSIPSQ